MVKTDKARAIEDLLIRMAQTGQLGGKVSESQLINLLEQINQQQKPETKITVPFKYAFLLYFPDDFNNKTLYLLSPLI